MFTVSPSKFPLSLAIKIDVSGRQNRYFGVRVPNCYFTVVIRYFLSLTRYPLLFVTTNA